MLLLYASLMCRQPSGKYPGRAGGGGVSLFEALLPWSGCKCREVKGCPATHARLSGTSFRIPQAASPSHLGFRV